LFYFKIADKFNIIDKPNERSSHNYITIRGGGIVWWLAGVVCSLFYLPESIYFLAGITLISIVSFWDDVSSLPNKIRITVHFLAISLLFYGLGIFRISSWWQIIIAYVFVVGILNAYNFMDGINGITGLYSLAILIVLQYVNVQMLRFTPPDFINYAILACVVFLFFNFRKRAKCFAGDIGSMAISFWIVALLLQLILKTQSAIWILFLMIYGVDTVCTILHRLFLRQNIFKAHRLHFYQALTNERGISHLKVAVGYALAQFIICLIIVFLYRHSHEIMWIVGIGMLALCCLIYLLKFTKLINHEK
jgi:UDP-N-acetylmuramyl pentapeptide phosphotransferase/UDP-N-acetylglucosamine-1-phosphate transferase